MIFSFVLFFLKERVKPVDTFQPFDVLILQVSLPGPLNGRLREGHPEVTGLAELVVVQLDESRHGLVDGRELHECHLAVLREKLEGRDGEADGVECVPQVLLLKRTLFSHN